MVAKPGNKTAAPSWPGPYDGDKSNILFGYWFEFIPEIILLEFVIDRIMHDHGIPVVKDKSLIMQITSQFQLWSQLAQTKCSIIARISYDPIYCYNIAMLSVLTTPR